MSTITVSQPESRFLPTLDASADPWSECAVFFLRHILSKSGSQSSLRNYHIVLRQFFFEQGRLPEAVTKTDVEKYINSPCQAPRNPGGEPSVSTVNLRLCVLRSFYNYAAAFIPTGATEPIFQRQNPTLGIYFGKRGSQPKSLTDEEIARFFSVIPQDTVLGLRDRALFITYLLTCRRRKEICRLRWRDIECTTIVDETDNQHAGWLYHFYGKGRGQQETVLELPEMAYRAIEKYLIASGRLSTMRPDDPLFLAVGPRQGGGRNQQQDSSAPVKPLHDDSVAWAMKQYCTKAGLDVTRLSIHSWRHSGIQQRLKCGGKLLDVMRISDHRSLDCFYRYTQHLMGTADPGSKAVEQRFAFLGQ